MKFMRAFFVLALGAAASSIVFATALPLPDNGVVQFSNLTGALVGVTTVPTPCINWSGGSTCAGATHLDEDTSSSNDFTSGATAADTIKDISTLGPVVLFQTAQAGSADGGSGATVNFDLVSIVLPNGGAGFGTCNNAANTSCNPAGSPFTLAEDGSGDVTLSFTALLEAYTGTSASGETPYKEIFTTQFTSALIGTGPCNGLAPSETNILSCEGGGGTIDASWSSTAGPNVPEPGTSAMMLLAGGSLVLLSRLRRPRKS